MTDLKKESKNPYSYVAMAMLLGGIVFFIGLDWNQSTIPSRASWSVPLMVIGGVSFVGGFLSLLFRIFGSGKKKT